MKKIFVAFLAVVMCVSLCACSVSDAEMSDNGGGSAVKPTLAPTIAPTVPIATEPVEDTATESTQGAAQPDAPTQSAACSHSFTEATCQKLATCSLCGESQGELADHKFNNKAACTVCGAANPTYSEIAKALKAMERYPRYIEINKGLVESSYDLFNMTGKMSHYNDAHKRTLEIHDYLKKVVEICQDYVEYDYWIKSMVEDSQECILEMPIVPTSTSQSSIRSYISKCKTYAGKADRIFVQYENLCNKYGVE